MEKKLDINTLEGWNEHLRLSYIKDLTEQGIEPTEENIESYGKEQVKKAYEFIEKCEAEKKLQPVPVYYYVGFERFDTEEEAEEYRKHIRELGKTTDTVLKIFNHSTPIDIPTEQIERVKNAADRELSWWGEFGKDSTIYLLGYLQGVRTERAKRRRFNERIIVK